LVADAALGGEEHDSVTEIKFVLTPLR
jgi:hypothetical protein